MRTRILLEQDEAGAFIEAGSFIDVSHEEPLTDKDVEALRALGWAGVAHIHDDRVVLPGEESAE